MTNNNQATIREARAAVLVPEIVLRAECQQSGIIRIPLRKV